MAKLELIKETENDKSYFYVKKDGVWMGCATSLEEGERIYDIMKRNTTKKTVEILKSEEV